MKLKNWAGLFLLCLGLMSCASVQQAAGLQRGKNNFAAGDYKTAFHQLLPVAFAGDAKAQYAVGYMYFYGYGVPIDVESGKFWINKAAAQHYFPAVHALSDMQKDTGL